MNLTLHIILKDLRALRWGWLLWLLACATHLALRLLQLGRSGETPDKFWWVLATSQRWDYRIVYVLPIILLPLLLHTDSWMGRLPFWKTIPISSGRLLRAKLSLALAAFVLLPFVCEIIYFLAADLRSVMGIALTQWAWRFLPGIAVVLLASAFVRSLKIALPLSFVAVGFVATSLGWPLGHNSILPDFVSPGAAEKVTGPPQAVMQLDPARLRFDRIVHRDTDPLTGKVTRQWEKMRVVGDVHTQGMPTDIVVHEVDLGEIDVHLPQRVEHDERSGPILRLGPGSSLPLQETRSSFARSDLPPLDVPGRWAFSSAEMSFQNKDLSASGALVKGVARLHLARRRLVTTLPLTSGAHWQAGLHRLTIDQAPPPNETAMQLALSLKTTLADPDGASAGLDFEQRPLLAAWIEHRSLPQRKLAFELNADAWRRPSWGHMRPMVISGSIDLSQFGSGTGFTDVTRSQKLTMFNAALNPVTELQSYLTPLSLARYTEEQAQVRNWNLALYTYEDAGVVELPFEQVLPKLSITEDEAEEDDDEKPRPAALSMRIGEIETAAQPTAESTRKLVSDLWQAVNLPPREDLRGVETLIKQKVSTAGPEQVSTLLAAVKAAFPIEDESTPSIYSDTWQQSAPSLEPYWRIVTDAAADLAGEAQREVIIEYHSPQIDLLRCIEDHRWTDAALGPMAAVASTNRAPDSWIDFFAKNPSALSQQALLAQIKFGRMRPARLAQLIATGAVPAHGAATVQWETAVARSGYISHIATSFGMALKHGVEIAPRDAMRLFRLKKEDILRGSSDLSVRQVHGRFTQLLSLRSDCPADAREGAAWLEQNVFNLRWSNSSGRFELGDKTTEPPDLAAWGQFVDPLGSGHASVKDGVLTLTTGGFASTFTYGEVDRVCPRVLRQISGDFTAEVTVQPTFRMGESWDTSSWGRGSRWQSAGWVIDGCKNRWVRFEHNIWDRPDNHELREESWVAGHNMTVQRHKELKTPWDTSKPIRMRLCRHGDAIYTAAKVEGGEWITHHSWRRGQWPDPLTVGLIVSNTTTKPVSAEFSDLSITPGSQPPIDKPFFPDPHFAGTPTPSGTEIPGWGYVFNPADAGVVSSNGNRLTIAAAPKETDLHAKRRMNAPRVLNDVDGDFSLEVTIDPVQEHEWTSAEVLLQYGNYTYLRFGPAKGNGQGRHIHVELFEDDWPPHLPHLIGSGQRLATTNPSAIDPAKPTRFRVQRSAHLLRIAWQQDSGPWTELYPFNMRHWPGKISVGVVAQNTSGTPFTGGFSDFNLSVSKTN